MLALICTLLFTAALPKSVAIIPLKSKNLGQSQLSSVVDDLLISELQRNSSGLRIVGQTDIEAVIGLEKRKDALGCDSAACLAEIGGALGVDSIMYGSLSRLGKSYMLSVSWVKARDATVIQRHSETLGDSEDQVAAGVHRTIATLLGQSPSSAPVGVTATPPGSVGGVTDFSSWEALSGVWYENEGGFYGSAGHLTLKQSPYKSYRFAVTAELVSGAGGGTSTVCVRTMVIPGKTQRNGTADIQAYCLNFAGTGIWNVYRGAAGSWFRMNPTDWPKSPALKPDSNRIEWRAKGDEVSVKVNGVELFRFIDRSLPFGSPSVGVHYATTTMRFSNVELEELK